MQRRANGAAIRAIREALGISQDELARRAAISPSHLCHAEHGRYRLSLPAAKRLADNLGVSFDAVTHLVSDEEPAA